MGIKDFLSGSKAKIAAAVTGATVVAGSAFYYYSTKAALPPEGGFDPAFKPYIAAYTGGMVSRESPVYITFTSEVAKPAQINVPVEDELFDFDPDIKGTVTWTDKNTIKFTPEEPLKSGQHYDVDFEIAKVMQMPEDLQEFKFNFRVMEQHFDIVTDGFRFYDNGGRAYEKMVGTLMTSDVAEAADVEKILTATQDGKKLGIRWTHNEDRTTHNFEVDSVFRTNSPGKVTLTWDGSSIGSTDNGGNEYEVPALTEFSLATGRVVQGQEQYVQLEFTDPLLPGQQLEGLVSIAGVPDARITSELNIIKIYPPVQQIGQKTVQIDQGIKNVDGKKLGKSETLELMFEEIKPSVRLIGKGVILPSTDGMIFPFEAVSLRSVEVSITKIHENNITQFFQNNSFSGQSELIRVGSQIIKKTVPLGNTNPSDYSRWKRYALDLSELIKTEPGAIYQVRIGFKKKNTFYNCESEQGEEGTGSESVMEVEQDEDYEEKEYSYWDYSEDYYEGENYDYSQRNNPCHASYYGSHRSVSRNVLATDLGVIAKKGANGEIKVIVTDIRTTEPIKDAVVEIYDYQQQILTSSNTNGDGIADVKPVKRPFFVIVKKDVQRNYLRLDDGSALSITGFDVSGETVVKGIKGFIYGERGVWRPGDSLFLTFVLENRQHSIPDNLPVVFELINPMGQVTRRIVNGTPVNGFYNFSTATAEEDPTGNWLAKVKVGGTIFSRPLKIETIKPNRLKIKMDFGEDKITSENNSIQGDLEAKWLHGAIADGLKAEVSMNLSKGETKFKKYEEYIFDDPARKFSSETVDIFSGRLNDQGKANVNAAVQTEGTAPGMLNANFKVRVFEEGGDFSTDAFSLPYSPYNTYVGMRVPDGDKARGMLLTDTNHTISVVSVDENGRPAGKRNIEMQVYKLEWRWWWEQSEDDISNILESEYSSPIASDDITTLNGKGSYSFRINYPDWGRYLIRAVDKESNHSTGKIVYVDWPGWAGKSRENTNGAASRLDISADKDKYQVGEKVNINIPGSEQGRALISVENGSRVLETYWHETQKGKNIFSFEVTEEMTPNIYINVTLIQPHAQTVNDLPIRMYGITALKIENPNTILQPVLACASEFRPEEMTSITVSEAKGKAMTYTLAIVDEGLLDLTRFKTPDPWNHFYAKEALGVRTFDMYDFVVGALGEKISSILSIGGDGEAGGKDGSKAKRFPPVVRYLGPFKLDAGEKATHKFMMPQYVGSVRVMVVAGDPSGAYGNAEKAVPVRKPLMVLATLPRVLGPEEYVALPVNIFAMNPKIRNVNVSVKTDNMLEIMQESSKSVTFNQMGDEVVNFYLKAKPVTGTSKVTVTASSGAEKATYVINIGIRNPNTEITKVNERVMSAGETFEFTHDAFGVTGSNKAVLEVSSIPPINLGSRLQYLIHYPYGCVEQTTSSVFPQLFVMDIINDNSGLQKRIETNVRAGIQRLRSFQLASGGFSYWPGEGIYNEWASNYAGHFLIEAEKKGYALPANMKELWIQSQKKAAKAWVANPNYEYGDDLTQAYRLYTLALAGQPETGAMNRLREDKKLSSTAQWRLAAAFALAGQKDVAAQIVANAPITVPVYQEMDYTFGSDTRDRALILEAMALLKMPTQGMQLLKQVSADLSGNKWMSTQETAYSLLAVSKFVSQGIKASNVNFVYSVNGAKAVNAVTEKKVAQVDLNIAQSGTAKTSVKNNSNGSLYVRVIQSGIPAAGEETAAENNLSLKVNYVNKEGKEINVSRLNQGTDFIAEVTVSNPGTRGDLKNIALKQIFPSGWEIHNYRMDNNMSAVTSAVPTYQDIRDDRVYTFFDLRAKESKTFRIMLNASYLGKFYLPAQYSEVMYEGTINSTVPGKWIEVVRPGEETLSLK